MKHYSWSAIGKFGTQIIGFFGNVLVARLLSPDDYGLVAMLSIFMSIAWNFTESGYADWLIRDPDAKKIDFSTVLVHNITLSILFYFVLFFAAPYLALFFQRTELIEITRILALSIPIKALTISEFTRMRKDLEFRNIAIIELLSNILATILAFVLAKSGLGYWALVGQTIGIGVFSMFLLVIINRWTPSFLFSWVRYKTMRKYGNNMLIAYLTNQLGANLHSIFIGKVYNSFSLGFYTQGLKISNIQFNGVNSIIMTTSFSLLSREKDDGKRRRMYESILKKFSFIHGTISFYIVGASDSLIGFLFGEKWLPSSILLQLLLISNLFRPLLPLNMNIIKIANKPTVYRNLTFFKNSLFLVALILTYKAGMISIIYGQIISVLIAVLVFAYFCGKKIDFGPLKQIKVVLLEFYVPLLSALLSHFIIVHFDFESDLLVLILFTVIFVLVCIFLYIPTRNETFFYFFNKLKGIIVKKRQFENE